LLFGLGQLGDVECGVAQRDQLATLRQFDWIEKGLVPSHLWLCTDGYCYFHVRVSLLSLASIKLDMEYVAKRSLDCTNRAWGGFHLFEITYRNLCTALAKAKWSASFHYIKSRVL
jgi:hypothetical protein